MKHVVTAVSPIIMSRPTARDLANTRVQERVSLHILLRSAPHYEGWRESQNSSLLPLTPLKRTPGSVLREFTGTWGYSFAEKPDVAVVSSLTSIGVSSCLWRYVSNRHVSNAVKVYLSCCCCCSSSSSSSSSTSSTSTSQGGSSKKDGTF